MRRGNFKPEEKEFLLGRLRRAVKGDAELTPPVLARRFGLSHVTVRKFLRELGLYVPRSSAAELKQTGAST